MIMDNFQGLGTTRKMRSNAWETFPFLSPYGHPERFPAQRHPVRSRGVS